MLRLFFDLRGAQIKEIHFEGHLGPSYVTATHNEIHDGGRPVPRQREHAGPAGLDREARPEGDPGAGRRTPPSPTPAASKKKAARRHEPRRRPATASSSPRGSRTASSRSRSTTRPCSRSAATTRRSPAPTRSTARGTESPPHSERAAYKWVFSLPTIGDYYGFEGTRWKDPPILDNPTDEKTIGDRDYKLYYDGDRLRMVAWQTDQGSFWLSNS